MVNRFLRRSLLAVLLVVVSAPVATAQTTPSGRVVFFALDEGYADCLPLTEPCLKGSTALVLVPASGRRVAWLPEATQLPERVLDVAALPAFASPPPNPETARYLVPMLDGAGVDLEFLPRRLEGGKLVALEGEGRPGDNVVPVLVGPVLGGAPSGDAADRVVEHPVVVDAGELRDAVPALLVRRVAPARVVFGVRTGDDYVALVGESGVAVLARRGDRVGLAAPVSADFEPPVTTTTAGSQQDGDDVDEVATTALRVLVVVGLTAGAVTVFRRRRRLSR